MSQAIAPKESKNHGLVMRMANRYELEPNKFLGVIEKTIFPTNSQPSLEQIAAFLVVANQYELNPFIKEIYAFPGRGGGIVPIVSVDGWLTIINRQPQLDGVEFQDHIDEQGNLTAVTSRVYRKDRSHATEVTEYMNECKRDTDTWRKWPARMLRHKALIQGARYAFGLAGIYDPDEAERIAEGETVPSTVVAEKTREKAADLRQRLVNAPVVEPEPEVELVVEAEIVADTPAPSFDEGKLKQELRDSLGKMLKKMTKPEKDEFLASHNVESVAAASLDQLNVMIEELTGR